MGITVWSHCQVNQNSCSNNGIHVLFEHGYYLKTLKTGQSLFALCYVAKCCSSEWSLCLCFCWPQSLRRWRLWCIFKLMPFCNVQQESAYEIRVIIMTFRHFWCDFRQESGKMQEYYPCLLPCINSCRVTWKMILTLGLWARVETTSLGPGKC